MGEFADDLIDKMFDLDDNEWDDWYDPTYNNPYRFTCKYCNRSNLKWQQTEFGWRLYDKRGIHKCKVRQLKNDPKPIYNGPEFALPPIGFKISKSRKIS